jgi:threonine/homoserine/homoserine lactone efflux protein
MVLSFIRNAVDPGRETLDMEGLLSFVVAGFALAGSPGPNTLSLAAAGAAFGARRGLRYLAGLVVGMIAVMLITATGVMGVRLAVPGATPAVAIMAAAYFLDLVFRIATAPPLAETDGHGRQPSFAAGLFLSLVNPKGYAAMAALFSGFVLIRERLALDTAAKVMVLAAIITVVNIAWLIARAALTRWFRQPGTHRAVNVTFAVLLVASLALALLF